MQAATALCEQGHQGSEHRARLLVEGGTDGQAAICGVQGPGWF